MNRPEIQSIRQVAKQTNMSANTVGAMPHPAPVLPEDLALGQELAAPRKAREVRVDSSYPRLLVAADMISIILGLAASVLIMHLVGREINLVRVSVTAALLLPVWFIVAYVAGLYGLAELKISHSVIDEIGKVVVAVTAWSWLLLMFRMVFSVFPATMLGPTVLWLVVIGLMLTGRTVARRVARRHDWHPHRVAVVGWPTESDVIRDRVDRHPEWGLQVEAEFEFGRDDKLGLESLANQIGDLDIDRVMIVGGSEGLIDRNRLVSLLVERGLVIDLVAGGAESLYSNSVLHDLEGLPVMSVRSSRLRPFDLRAKRLFDIAIACAGLLFTSPILAWAAIRIKLDSSGPVFFRQVRCGVDGSPFEVVKFRTMVNDADDLRDELRAVSEEERNGDVLFKLEEDPRVTVVGRTLRKWSVDELPQLWNVLKGEMSIVGPRPLPFDEADQATGVFSARTRVKPGLAGPWQAYGRSAIPFDDMIRLDYSYAVGWSLAEDMRLLLRTANAVFGRRGAY